MSWHAYNDCTATDSFSSLARGGDNFDVSLTMSLETDVISRLGIDHVPDYPITHLARVLQ